MYKKIGNVEPTHSELPPLECDALSRGYKKFLVGIQKFPQDTISFAFNPKDGESRLWSAKESSHGVEIPQMGLTELDVFSGGITRDKGKIGKVGIYTPVQSPNQPLDPADVRKDLIRFMKGLKKAGLPEDTEIIVFDSSHGGPNTPINLEKEFPQQFEKKGLIQAKLKDYLV